MSERSTGPLRVGLVVQGKIDPAAWSGSYAGIARGLRAHGAEVVALDFTLPLGLERAALRLPWWRTRVALHQIGSRLRVRSARSLDAILQVGSATVVKTDLPLASLLDMTLRQGLAVGERWYSSRSASELAAWEARQREVYDRSGRILAMGEWAARSVISDYGVAAERVRVVGAGITHTVPAVPRDWSAPRFLFIGRDFQRKNGAAVLRAFAQLHERNPAARLDLVGDHPPLAEPGVTGHGPLALGDAEGRARIEQLLTQATCFVMPSHYEPFGIAYVEAATAGVPSIATTVGASFVIPECGLKVDPGDPGGLLAAMELMSQGDRAQELGARARDRAAMFTWPLVGGRVIRAFHELLGRPVDGLPDYL